MHTLILSVLFAMPTHAATLNIDDLKTIAVAEAVDHDLNVERFLKVIECESGWDTRIISKTGDYGLVQINAKSWPAITKSEMYDPYFSLHFMAEQWSLGNARAWVCFNKLYKKGYHV